MEGSIIAYRPGPYIRTADRDMKYTIFELSAAISAVAWLKYCRYGVKHYPINQLIRYFLSMFFMLKIEDNFKRNTSILHFLPQNEI